VLAAELVALKVAVIAALGSIAAQAALQATQTIPIVFLSGDPVALGLVTSFNRPGGNATGISVLAPELVAKRLELLRELIPGARSVAFLGNPGNPTAASQLRDVQAAARITGHSLQIFEARTGSEIEQAFARLAEQRPDALLVSADPLFTAQRDQIVALAQRHNLPALYDFPEYAAAGGLISYGPSLKDLWRQLGVYTGRIIAGAKPADMPVQQPTQFELVINLTAAKALGLTIPPAILARADELIE
jgi:putative ABC transport system substrate-binding protein